MSIKLIYGSDTGMTEDMCGIVEREFDQIDEVVEVSEMKEDDWSSHNVFMIGLSTWYDGDLVSAWEDYFDEFKTKDFSNKTFCLFGLGDQEGYAEYFIDGVGMLAEVIIENGGTIIGNWSTEGYDYEESKGEINKEMFYGLALDEDNQDELSEERISQWIVQLKKELELVDKLKSYIDEQE